MFRSLEGTLTLTKRRDVEVVVISPKRFGWPMVVDSTGREHDMHWLQRTRAWRTFLGYRPPGDAIVVVDENVWTLPNAAMLALCHNCAPPQLIPPNDDLGRWAALTTRVVKEARRSKVRISELMIAAYEASAA